MMEAVTWERGDRCRDCGIRPDEALGLEFCQCPGKQPIDELAERAYYAGFQACARATADTIPRAVLVKALRDRAITWTEVVEDGEETFLSDCSARRAWELRDVADEIERGEWPRDGEGK